MDTPLPGFIKVCYWDPRLDTFIDDSCVHSVGGRGRSSYYISHHQLEFRIGTHFTVPDIAHLGVSTSTIIRRMRALGIGVRQTYSHLLDHRLDQLVHEVTTEFPSAGCTLIQSHLRARGYRVTERRIRLSKTCWSKCCCSEMDHSQCWFDVELYHVPFPNALWHMDGNMPDMMGFCCLQSSWWLQPVNCLPPLFIKQQS